MKLVVFSQLTEGGPELTMSLTRCREHNDKRYRNNRNEDASFTKWMNLVRAETSSRLGMNFTLIEVNHLQSR